jgi:hypothetical protein
MLAALFESTGAGEGSWPTRRSRLLRCCSTNWRASIRGNGAKWPLSFAVCPRIWPRCRTARQPPMCSASWPICSTLMQAIGYSSEIACIFAAIIDTAVAVSTLMLVALGDKPARRARTGNVSTVRKGPEHHVGPASLGGPYRGRRGRVSVDDPQAYCGMLGPESEGARPCFPESGQRPRQWGNQDGASCHTHNLSSGWRWPG